MTPETTMTYVFEPLAWWDVTTHTYKPSVRVTINGRFSSHPVWDVEYSHTEADLARREAEKLAAEMKQQWRTTIDRVLAAYKPHNS